MKQIKTLILEDDLETLSVIFSMLARLEENLKLEFLTTVISESPKVEELINKHQELEFDLILLDRDCKVGGSFHNLDIDRFGVNKIIAISSVPEYNEQLKQIGVNRIVDKDYRQLDDFVRRLEFELSYFLR